MDKAKALALIDQQRRCWRWQAPDTALARRAERVFFRVALVYFIGALLFLGIGSFLGVHVFYAMAGTLLFCGAFLFWRSRRFTEVLRVLSDAKTDVAGSGA